MKVFGPVPSRRLGRSMGINNIPPKHCPYSCIYCQVGLTDRMEVKRQSFYKPEDLFQEAKSKLKELDLRKEPLDYITFVSDGEPTLDINLNKTIGLLKQFKIKIAVITNSSLIWQEEVRKDLKNADMVSIKIDSTRDKSWRKINRPHKDLNLASILEGIKSFKKYYRGKLITETMIVDKVNDGLSEIKELAEFLGSIESDISYISIPIRPPAVKGVKAPKEETINYIYQIISQKVKNTEYLTGYEGNAFSFTGDAEKDLLSITAVHPMKEEAIKEFLVRADAPWKIIEKLVEKNKISRTYYNEEAFYVRNFSDRVQH